MREDKESQPDAADTEDIVFRMDNPGEEAENAPGSVTEALRDVPPSVQKEISGFMAISQQIGNPLLAKFNADHIHKSLDYMDAENLRGHKQAHSTRKFALAFFIAVLVAVVGVLVFLVWQDERELAGQILAGLAIFGGGFGGGYGLGRRR